MMHRLSRLTLFLGLTLLLLGCQPAKNTLDINIVYTPPLHRISPLRSSFPPLTPEEKTQEWANELKIGESFARELDLYRAITAFKRAIVLLPPELVERRLQLDYDLINCYYLGHKYTETVNVFEDSLLVQATPAFPAFNNLLILLYHSYKETKQEEKAETILELINKCSPETGNDLVIFWDIKTKSMESLEEKIINHREEESIHKDINTYYAFAKSPQKARTLNAILPGAGYYYVGQKKSALTSFIINTLFVIASYQFFDHGYPAAGLITASMEVGWYMGGINGAGIAAEEFNERVYEGIAKKTLVEKQLFPILMFETSF